MRLERSLFYPETRVQISFTSRLMRALTYLDETVEIVYIEDGCCRRWWWLNARLDTRLLSDAEKYGGQDAS